MAEFSGFFNAKIVNDAYDREYHADDFAEYFANFVGNGVFEDNLGELMVSQNDVADMGIKVLSGQAFINGYRYKNDDEFFLSIDVADGILNRIDLIVLRLDVVERKIHLAIKRGTPAASALVPDIQRDSDIYELKLAEISIKAGATNISQTEITDTRDNKDVCGFVRTVADKDLVSLNESVNSLKTQVKALQSNTDKLEEAAGVESEQYPGCFYKVASNGEFEWINPPAMAGIEYRLTERWENKPVYQKRFYIASLTDGTEFSIRVGVPGDKVISVEGFMYDTEESEFFPFPLVRTNVVNTSAAIGQIGSTGYLTIFVDIDMTGYRSYVTVKYVKS